MFDVGFYEILLILVVAVFVLKPTDLGTILYKAGKIIGAIKAQIAPIKSYTKDLIQEAEIDTIKDDAFKTMQKREKQAHEEEKSHEKEGGA